MSATLQEIRRQLREKFPAAHGFTPVSEEPREDARTLFEVNTFPAGTISEIVPAAEGGLSLWIAGLLGEPDEAEEFPRFVLVDGGDHFDPASYPAAACSQLLWVRCAKVPEALKAADLLVRDGNVPFVMLDLCGLPWSALRGIPGAAWWRLKQLAEKSACRLVVLSPAPLVPCASLRLSLSTRLTLEDFEVPRGELLPRVEARPERLRQVT